MGSFVSSVDIYLAFLHHYVFLQFKTLQASNTPLGKVQKEQWVDPEEGLGL